MSGTESGDMDAPSLAKPTAAAMLFAARLLDKEARVALERKKEAQTKHRDLPAGKERMAQAKATRSASADLQQIRQVVRWLRSEAPSIASEELEAGDTARHTGESRGGATSSARPAKKSRRGPAGEAAPPA